jgi:hypothetical protein
MRAKRLFRALAVAIIVSSGLIAGAVTSGAGATAAKTPKLVVTPSGGLRNGQVVKVSGSGFKAHDQVFIVECLATAQGQAQCATLGATLATISAKGLLASTKFKVATGKIGNGKCGTTTANLKSCAISVGNISGGDSATARIYFIAPKKAKG